MNEPRIEHYKIRRYINCEYIIVYANNPEQQIGFWTFDKKTAELVVEGMNYAYLEGKNDGLSQAINSIEQLEESWKKQN